MYRLVLYGLLLITGSALTLSAVGTLGYPLVSLTGSLAVIIMSGLTTDFLLRRAFKAASNLESWLITSLILFLILRPADDLSGYAVLALGTVIAMTSKYLLTITRKHLFNPVAIALVVLGLLGSGEVFWWVGTAALLPVVLPVGLLVAHKIRRLTMVGLFMVLALASFAWSSGLGLQPVELIRSAVLSGPLVFFATIMLTEPATATQPKYWRLAYAGVVGILYGAHINIGMLYSTPELALVLGNLLAFTINPKRRYEFTFTHRTPQGGGIVEFNFSAPKPLQFLPGQYLEWTLPHHRPDSRGNRRYFTIASSPLESAVKVSVRIDPTHSSSFKRALQSLQAGDNISASHLSGDFVLPRDTHKKLVFIAGGVGITPFRSMVTYLLERKEKRDITLLYSAATADGFAYRELFDSAAANTVTAHYVLTGQEVPPGWTGLRGYLSPKIIRSLVPEYRQALFYLSGPQAMVAGYKKMLIKTGVPRRHIKTDYFPGF